MAAEYGRPVPQHGPGADRLPGPPRRREARRKVPRFPTPRPVRQDRDADDGRRDGRVRELPAAGLRARLGNLYLQDGVWNGERILPEGWSKFVSTLAPAWEADKRPIYGGFFWLNGDGQYPVPKDAYFMSGAGGQTTMIIPSHDLVVVRLGHYRGDAAGA